MHHNCVAHRTLQKITEHLLAFNTAITLLCQFLVLIFSPADANNNNEKEFQNGVKKFDEGNFCEFRRFLTKIIIGKKIHRLTFRVLIIFVYF